ncbi:MAG: hypothetical protein WCE51_10135 [Chthoniobacterales bacterium]
MVEIGAMRTDLIVILLNRLCFFFGHKAADEGIIRPGAIGLELWKGINWIRKPLMLGKYDAPLTKYWLGRDERHNHEV